MIESLVLGAKLLFLPKEDAMSELPKLPLGQQEFSEIRRLGMVYVDKTRFIHNLLKTKAPFWFLARPRRFGKSLLISTLKAIFEGRKELFEGLYIYDKIEWEAHPVIHLDFSNIDFKGKGLEKAIYDRLTQIANANNLSLIEKTIGSMFSELMTKLHQKTGQQVAILIDEYDKPITDVLEVGNNAKAYEHRDTMRSLYSVVKGSSEHIRFFFLTGIARFSKVSLFSDLNNVTDLASENDYHNFLGYTQQELESYFAPHLRFIAQEKGISIEELMHQIRYWYNGFSWNGIEKLYNPYSILRFLSAREFRNFWFDSGTPKFLIEIMKSKMMYDIPKSTATLSEVENFDMDNLNIETLLFQTGYLSAQGKDSRNRLILDYPNHEVEISMTEHILKAFAYIPKSSIALDLTIAIENHDMELLVDSINILFASIPHQIFDQNQEKYFHAILFSAFKLCGFYIQAEVSVANGRIDAVMHYQSRVYIFEFKLNASADVSIKQIHERGYYRAFQNQGKEIYLLGIGFSGSEKKAESLKIEKVD